MKKRWGLAYIGVCTLSICCSCTPQTQHTEAVVGQQVSESGRENVAVHMDRYPFPTGAQIVSRTDIAGTLRSQPNVAGAVVIESDRQAYVAVQPYQQPLSGQQRDAIVRTVRRFDSGVDRVLVTSKPDAFADFENYSRYLLSGRRVQGMLLTWRSIVRRAWGTNNLSGS